MSAAERYERYDHHLAGVAILIRRLVEYGMSTNWVREITLLADSDDFLAVAENCKVAADEQSDPDLSILLWKVSELAELIDQLNPEEEEEDDAAEEK